MNVLDLLIYEATVEIFDDRYPSEIQPVSETTQLDFYPITDSDRSWAEGHCYTLVRGGEKASYRVRVPAGEWFTKEFEGGYSKTFLRTPELKAADAVVVICCVQYQQYGFVQVPLKGGKMIELLSNPLAEVQPARVQAKPRTVPVPSTSHAGTGVSRTAAIHPAVAAPSSTTLAPVDADLTPWRPWVDHKPDPVTPKRPAARHQLSMFGEPEGVSRA